MKLPTCSLALLFAAALLVGCTQTSPPPGNGSPPIGGDPVVSIAPVSAPVDFGQAVTLSGSAATNPQRPLSYAWQKLTGPGEVAFADASQQTTTATFDRAGTYDLELSATDANGRTGRATMTVLVKFEGNVYRINSGATTPLMLGGVTWEADEFYSGGSVPFTTGNASEIAETELDPLYLSERNSSLGVTTFSYNIPVSDGTYRVVLHFAEIYFSLPGRGQDGGVGSRVFDVRIEGETKLENYDIFARVGALTAITETFEVTVTDGILNIEFEASQNRPKVSALEIIALSE